MRDVHDWDESDLDSIVKAAQEENTVLDYKNSAALNFKDATKTSKPPPNTLGEKHRQDLIRDVAAMANAEGGLIIYGIAERKGGFPKNVDDGIDQATVDADTIEQIILSNISPRVEGFFIKPIEMISRGKSGYAYVIQIPKAGKNAPHQSDDKVYYKRHGATKLPMSDNEVRDMIGRSLEFGRKYGIAWDLLVEVRRIIAAAAARSEIGQNDYLPRRMLSISVSPSLRSSGVAVMALPRPLRGRVARLINDVDKYNSNIETKDSGQRDEARLTDPLRALLRNVMANGDQICDGLLEVLANEPEP